MCSGGTAWRMWFSILPPGGTGPEKKLRPKTLENRQRAGVGGHPKRTKKERRGEIKKRAALLSKL